MRYQIPHFFAAGFCRLFSFGQPAQAVRGGECRKAVWSSGRDGTLPGRETHPPLLS